MKRSSWLWLSLAASSAAHGLFAWQLSASPRARRAPPDRDTFEVRMVALPPPTPPPPPAPPEPEPTPESPPPPVAPKRKPMPKAPEPAPAEPAPAEPVPVVTSAPTALLADTGVALGSAIVQLAGAPIAAVSITARPPALEPARPPPPIAPGAAALAKLSDLSRKPKAPPLDAALRQNYPGELRRRGTEGQAEVRIVIDPRGRVGEIAIVSETAAGFAEACRKTLVGSRWSEPLDREGQPVSTRLTYRCRFQIER